ncbi:MAG: hypothetical protein ACTSU2_05800 [Promethearchaeota archaeon]
MVESVPDPNWLLFRLTKKGRAIAEHLEQAVKILKKDEDNENK